MSNSRRFSYVLTVWNPVRFLCAQKGLKTMLKLLSKIKNKIIPKHPLLVAHEEMAKSIAEGFKKGIEGEN